MSIVLEASLLLGAYLSVALAAYWLLLHKFHKLPRPRENDGPRLATPHDRMLVNGRRGSSTPLLCKTCKRHPWNRGPELLCDACTDRYLDALDEFSRSQMDGVW